jgi:hypothetical protein
MMDSAQLVLGEEQTLGRDSSISARPKLPGTLEVQERLCFLQGFMAYCNSCCVPW